MNELQLNDIASKIVAEILANTASLNDQWDHVLISKFNISIDPGVHNTTWLEIAFFGTYTLLRGIQSDYSEDDYVKLVREIKQQLVRMILMVVFTEANKEKQKVLEQYIKGELESSLRLYEEHVGDTSEVLRNLIRDKFNTSETSKIKFVESNWLTKLKLKFAFALGDANFQAKHAGEQFIPNDVLLSLSNAIALQFRTIEKSGLRMTE